MGRPWQWVDTGRMAASIMAADQARAAAFAASKGGKKGKKGKKGGPTTKGKQDKEAAGKGKDGASKDAKGGAKAGGKEGKGGKKGGKDVGKSDEVTEVEPEPREADDFKRDTPNGIYRLRLADAYEHQVAIELVYLWEKYGAASWKWAELNGVPLTLTEAHHWPVRHRCHPQHHARPVQVSTVTVAARYRSHPHTHATSSPSTSTSTYVRSLLPPGVVPVHTYQHHPPSRR